MNRFHNRDQRGASLVEYALLVALIGVVIIAAVTALGKHANAQAYPDYPTTCSYTMQVEYIVDDGDVKVRPEGSSEDYMSPKELFTC